jgi:hypothetical protein
MTHVQSEILRVRVTPRIRVAVEEFASRNALLNKAGDPSISAGVRTILEMAASDGSQEDMYRIAYANARVDLLQKVSEKYGLLISELSKL